MKAADRYESGTPFCAFPCTLSSNAKNRSSTRTISSTLAWLGIRPRFVDVAYVDHAQRASLQDFWIFVGWAA